MTVDNFLNHFIRLISYPVCAANKTKLYISCEAKLEDKYKKSFEGERMRVQNLIDMSIVFRKVKVKTKDTRNRIDHGE